VIMGPWKRSPFTPPLASDPVWGQNLGQTFRSTIAARVPERGRGHVQGAAYQPRESSGAWSGPHAVRVLGPRMRSDAVCESLYKCLANLTFVVPPRVPHGS
jgi:hypothetical protein